MEFYLVDVFAEEQYAGNQLAVFLASPELDGDQMQRIAREVNFSETTFIVSGRQENGGYAVRIFTPDVEVPFAGHPTLGTAFVIHQCLEQGRNTSVLLNYAQTSITVDVEDAVYAMVQDVPQFGQVLDDAAILERALCLRPDDIRVDMPIQLVSTGLSAFIVPLASMEALTRCAVDHAHFLSFINKVYKCNVLVFVQESAKSIRARVFLDDTGFREDAATGTLPPTCCATPHPAANCATA